jgi:hypothetical protein
MRVKLANLAPVVFPVLGPASRAARPARGDQLRAPEDDLHAGRSNTGLLALGVALLLLLTLGAIAFAVRSGIASVSWSGASGAAMAGMLIFLIFFCCLLLLSYFLPSFIAYKRGHQDTGTIFFINLLLGWTLFGWVACLIWAFTAVERPGYRGWEEYGYGCREVPPR